MKEGLSLLCKTGNGLAHAFVKFEAREKWVQINLLWHLPHFPDFRVIACKRIELSNLPFWKNEDELGTRTVPEIRYWEINISPPSFFDRELTDISFIQTFIHLRYVDLSDNMLRDISPLACLTHLLWLKLDGNRLISASMDDLPYLQIASFANNHIKDTNGINHPRLTNLNLKGRCYVYT